MDFTESVIDAAQTWVCRNLDTAETLNNYFDRLTVSRRGVSLPISEIASPIRNFGRYLYQCPASGGPYPPVGNGQFTGGQCIGDQYTVQAVATRLANGVPVQDPDVINSQQTYTGPIESVQIDDPPNSISVTHNFGQVSNLITQVNPIITYTNLRDVSVNNITQPSDPCGNSGGTPPDISYDQPDGTPVTESVSITIGDPVLMPDGDIVIPVTVAGPGWEVRVDLPANGEPRVGVPDTPVGESPCCAAEEPESDPPPPDEPPPPDGTTIISGCFVTTNTPDDDINATQVFVAGGPTLFFPRIGSVIFGVKKGNVLSWLAPVDVQIKNQFVPCPDPRGAVAVVGAPQNVDDFIITSVREVILDETAVTTP